MEAIFILFFLTFGLALTAVWIFALIDVVRSDFRGNNDKIIWLLLVILLPFLGTILYFVIGQSQKLDAHPEELV